ncbi:cbb3-type cytochrome c oxidase subunit 3 [Pseudomonas fluorescens]|uniref:Uncharacterized protein n=1 Tax=Pseudomonas fluorescens TaxID=294 RepID=A0A5E7ABJ8_PSEFL|nr:cbb3-type cytochrome c oxidase subunit 3 [Pseudomonas fluorescens]VVN75829.1 hypothetical protein PS691_00717 [Pseudomonas fluorescens]
MIEIALDVLGVVCLYLSVEYCLRNQSPESLDEASLIPFADDPEVARWVELATGKSIRAVAPEGVKVGWGNVEI